MSKRVLGVKGEASTQKTVENLNSAQKFETHKTVKY
jgi:hypothetical protein